MRVGPDANYLADVLPAVIVFGLGLSATVAPLTATVLDSVEERHVGIASGVNNGVARVAGLLSVAVLGAVIAAKFDASVGREVANGPLTAGAPDASAAAFHLGMLIAGLLMIAGGIFAGIGIENPRRETRSYPHSRRCPGRRVWPQRRLRRDPARTGPRTPSEDRGRVPLEPADTQKRDLIRSRFVGARGTRPLPPE